jgi:hypothetical protein
MKLLLQLYKYKRYSRKHLGRKRINRGGGLLADENERGVSALPVDRFISTNQNLKVEFISCDSQTLAQGIPSKPKLFILIHI